MASQLAFGFFALLVVVAAWRVVTTPDVVRAALALVIVLGGMAPLFVLLAAEFVAVAQVLVYVGAVIVLFLFGVMLTRRSGGTPTARTTDPAPGPDAANQGSGSVDHRVRWPGVVIALVLFGVLWLSIRDAFGTEPVDPRRPIRTAEVGDVLLRQHVVAFEAVSVLLLAALIGAVVLARRD